MIHRTPSNLQAVGQRDEQIYGISRQEFNKLWQWHASVPPTQEECVHEIFQQRCRECPDAPAVCAWDGGLTYRELDDVSSQLAAHLIQRGVGPEIFVPLCFEKSRWATVAIVAVMKAGGAFVLLDPSHPLNRLQDICEDLDARIILSSVQNSELTSQLTPETVIVGDIESAWHAENAVCVSTTVQPHNALYAVFTSGSTGKPKGVVIEHRCLSSGMRTQAKAFTLHREARVLQFASYAFDVSILETLGTLYAGGCICTPSESQRSGPFEEAVEMLRPTHAMLTPSFARSLHPSQMGTVKTLVMGAEQVLATDVAQWAEHIRLVSGYGTSECTIATTVLSSITPGSDFSNIGYAKSCVCWIVDPDNHDILVPVGAVGELLVEGPIVGRGYLNNPDKTRQAFIEPPPWLTEVRHGTATRLYKTGDLVRYAADGSLCIIGRKDTQVKVRGHRIELGEVETHVQQWFAGARDVVAEVVKTGSDNEANLVTFIWRGQGSDGPRVDNQADSHIDDLFGTPNEDFRNDVAAAEALLPHKMPSYMLPKHFIPILHVPRTVAGKVDHRLLQQTVSKLTPDQLRLYTPGGGRDRRAVSTETEQSLQHIWSEVLGLSVENISADDSFFHLNGSSISAMKVVAAARNAGLELTIADVFGHPRLADLAGIATRSSQSASSALCPFALVDTALQEQAIQVSAEQCGVESDQIEDIYPCTALQEGLIAITAQKPGAYVAQWKIELPSGIDLQRFQSAWNTVAEQHKILRTRIFQTDFLGMIQVVIREPVYWETCLELDSDIVDQTQREVMPGRPLVRLIATSKEREDGHQLLLTIHHALYDAWSLPLLLRHVEEVYAGNSPGKSSFGEFVKHTSALADSESYWQSQFAGLQARSFPQLPSASYQPQSSKAIEIPAHVSTQNTRDYTRSTAIRLAWAIVQSRYQNNNDVVFGVTVSGRNAPVLDIETLTGPTIATIPERVVLNPGTTITTMLEELQHNSVSVIPFEQTGLRYISKCGSEAAAACAFQTLLVVESDENEDVSPMFGRRHCLMDERDSNIYGLTIICHLQKEGHIRLEANYDELVLPEPQVLRILHQLSHVLRQITDSPNLCLADLTSVNTRDYAEMTQWNSHIAETVDECAHDLIRRHSLMRPEAPAVCAWDGNFTHSELDVLSSRLAAQLAVHGVGPEVFVPVCFVKSKWTIVAMLGIMKAGGAFVLLDPSYPLKRLQGICEDLKSTVILSAVENVPLSNQLAKTAITVSSDDVMHWNEQEAGVDVQSYHPVYAVFTSGSTGKPKGVVIEHASFCSGALAQHQAFSVDHNARVLQFASYAFDASIEEILVTLAAGGCVCVPSEEQRRDQLKFSNITRDLDPTHAFLTPSFARSLNDTDFGAIKTLILMGEQMWESDLARWKEKLHLINGYGPAECTIATAVQPWPTTDPTNIGFPTGCACWIVDPDDHSRLVPIGAVGELIVEGPIVSRGYLNEPDKTAAAFIQLPSWLQELRKGKHNRHVYKTGDLVRYESNGSLCYKGRKDTQVKLRGQRIELGEVENHVQQCFPESQDVVAEVVETEGTTRLMAFVLRHHEPGPTGIIVSPSEAFRDGVATAEDRLHEAVPSYMIPASFIEISYIPRTAAGKTDRTLLRNLVLELSLEQLRAYRPVSGQRQAVSSGPEELLQGIWARVLNLPAESISANDDFFRIGGDSITAMQVSSQARTKKIPHSVPDIFRWKTISQIIENAVSSTPALIETQEEADVAFDLSPIQQFFFEKQPEGHNQFNQSFLLQISEKVSIERIQHALRIIVSQHSMLRARFCKQEDGAWQQIITNDPDTAYVLRCHDGVEQSSFSKIMLASQQSLNIQTGPIFIADVIESSSNIHYLFLVAHHLVVDLVSWRIIIQDLEEILRHGTTSEKELVPFQTWSRMQAEHGRDHLLPSTTLPDGMSQDQFDIVEEYWGIKDQDNLFNDIAVDDFLVDEKSTRVLLGSSNDAFGTQPAEILHAALIHAFAQVFQDRPLPVIFSEGHGREPWRSDIDLSRTVGWFTSIYPVPVNLMEAGDISSAVCLAKDARRQVANNGWSYFSSRFLNSNGRQTFKHHTPIEILFNYTGQYQQFENPDALFKLVTEHHDESMDFAADIRRFAFFDVSATVSQGRLHFQFVYNRQMARQDAIREWIDHSQKTLNKIAEQFPQMKPRYTAADFPLLSMTYDQLEQFNATLAETGVSQENLEDVYPCSPIQRGILLSQAWNSAHYQVKTIWNVAAPSQPVNIDRLQKAWQIVVQRHSALRTTFVKSVSSERYLDQVVLKNVNPDIFRFHCNEQDPLEALRYHIKTVSDESLLPHRFTICTSNVGDVFCQLEISHAVIDAASMGVIQHELQLAYSDQLPVIQPLSYKTYISHVQNQSKEAAVRYWGQYLEGYQPCQFPKLSQSKQLGNTLLHSIRLSSVDGPAVHQFCNARKVTISNLCSLAWAFVLRCYTRSDDICFGYLASGRDLLAHDAQNAVGPFINTLVSRINLNNDGKVHELLQTVQDDYIDSLPHQTLSLADVKHSVGQTGAMFNTAMSFQRGSTSADKDDAALQMTLVDGQDPSEYDIVLNITASGQDVDVEIGYWTSCMSELQAQLVAATFEKAVSEILLTGEDTCARELDLFSDMNKTQVWKWNAELAKPVDSCLHDTIIQQCLERPNSLAICAFDGDFTYRELDNLSSRLATYLSQQGVGPDVFVPILFEKSRWIAVAILGVMKAGGAFVLLDPSHPASRLQGICVDINATIILSSHHQIEVSKVLVPNVVVVDDQAGIWCLMSTEYPPTRVLPDDALYAVFTSGSTGKPKGVVIEHRSYCSAAKAHCRAFDITAAARVLQFASYAFDASILEILSTLMAGGCVCILSESQRKDRFDDAVRDLHPTHALLTPSFARTMQTAGSIQTLILMGEPISAADITAWSGKVQLMNGYGPAECSVCSTVQSCVTFESNPANIGRPTGGACWVVDENDHNKLLPIGAIGELVIEGPIVGRGYLNNPEKTQQSFIHSTPWLRELRQETPSRLYKTGDLARYEIDGSLTYLGRKDSQVKLRGQRLELGEIENNLLHCFSGAEDVVAEVIVPAGHNSSPRLISFVRREKDQIRAEDARERQGVIAASSQAFRTDAAAAKSRLQNLLPHYMIPTVILPLAYLPLTRAGKKDRICLRQAASDLTVEQLSVYNATSDEKRAVSSDEEKILRRIWANVLGIPVPYIGADDQFFHLGGDSVSAMKVTAAARQEGLALTVSDIFNKPILSELAAIQPEEPAIVLEYSPFSLMGDWGLGDLFGHLALQDFNIQQGNISDILPVTQVQTDFLNTHSLSHFSFQMIGEINAWRLQAACTAVVKRHSILRTVFARYGDSYAQVILQDIETPFVQRHVVRLPQGKSEGWALEEESLSWTPLGSLPLQFTLMSANPTEHLFRIQLSHAQYDGLSISLLLKDLAAAYQGDSLDQTKDFADYVYHRNQQDTQRAFDSWRDILEGSSITPVPSDQPIADISQSSCTNTGRAFATRSIALPTCPADLTMATLVKASWSYVLSRTTGRSDVVFGQVVNGRNLPLNNIDQIAGPCMNNLPFRVQVDTATTVIDLLRHVQDQHSRSMEYDYLNLQEIIKHSTSWPEGTDTFGSFVQHQNIDLATSSQQPLLIGNCQTTSISSSGTSLPTREVWIYSIPQNAADSDGKLVLQIQASRHIVSQERAEWLIEKLGETILAFAREPERTLLESVEV